jgi:RAD54-like protein 2
MGLGKTLITISFVEVFLRYTGRKCVLIIVPINTIQNWQNEFNNWLPEDGQQKIDTDTIISYKRPFKLYLINDFAKTIKQRSEIICKFFLQITLNYQNFEYYNISKTKNRFLKFNFLIIFYLI